MSAFIVLATPMLDEQCLMLALMDLGFERTQIEVHEQAVSLHGYASQGYKANIIIRRQHTGDVYNDLGFLLTETGYRAYISDDHPRYNRPWLSRVHECYLTHHQAKQARLAAEERARLQAERRRLVAAQREAIRSKALSQGYRVEESKQGNVVRLVLAKRVY